MSEKAGSGELKPEKKAHAKRPPAVPRGEGARISLRLWCNDSLPREEGMGEVSRKTHRDEAAAERVSHIKDSGCSFSKREIAWMGSCHGK